VSEPPKAVATAADKAWWTFKYYHPKTAEDPRLSFVFAYRRACTDMMADQFGFAGWDLLTRRLLEVLEELVVERQAVAMVDLMTGEVLEATTEPVP
jgi:hypothetical protein